MNTSPPSSASTSLRAAMELLSSMRFAIALLTVICIASVIGTVLQQQQPFANYVNQFGPFWAEVFGKLGLYAVYSAGWFLVILAFLVISTTLCIIRNTPKILNDLRSYKEHIRAQAWKAFHHRAQSHLALAPEEAAKKAGQALVSMGWKVKLQQRENSWLVAAKAGAANKLGYLAAHGAIVLICLGGLFDGDLIVRAQMWLGDKTLYRGGGMVADVPAEHRLSMRNPTFRGNLMVAEGTMSDTAVLTQPGGIVLQELPFAVELKKFIIEHYSTGMPKLFASEIIIHDKTTGEQVPARVEVNRPAFHDGIAIYQSSFDDGGSAVKLKAQPIDGTSPAFEIEGQIGTSTQLSRGSGPDAESLALEFTELRVINVENFASGETTGDARGFDLRSVATDLHRNLGAANKHDAPQTQRNVGPSIGYKLRDAAGQAREFHNYMLPIDLGDGSAPVYLWGVRDTPAEPFRYLRVPMDAEGSSADFFRLRAALATPTLREQAVRRYAARMVDANRPDLQQQLAASALRALTLFAGGDALTPFAGLQAISDFLEQQVAEAERERAGEMLLRILNGSLFELLQITRERAKLKPLPPDEKTQAYMSQAVLALSDVAFYPAPFVLQLQDFQQVQASVFQVARAPGKIAVYLGFVLLILGVFAMLYVRERRLWIWLEPQEAQKEQGDNSTPGSHARMALSSNRQTLDVDREFEQLQERLLKE